MQHKLFSQEQQVKLCGYSMHTSLHEKENPLFCSWTGNGRGHLGRAYHLQMRQATFWYVLPFFPKWNYNESYSSSLMYTPRSPRHHCFFCYLLQNPSQTDPLNYQQLLDHPAEPRTQSENEAMLRIEELK